MKFPTEYDALDIAAPELAEKLLPKPRKTGVEEYVLICSHRRCLSVQNASETIGASCSGNSGAHPERLLTLR